MFVQVAHVTVCLPLLLFSHFWKDCRIVIIIIIIITNEKIKVMLSVKRCRGTLQDYTKGEISEC